MGPSENGAGVAGGRTVGLTADVVSLIHRPVGVGPGPDDGASIAGLVAVIRATVIPPGTGGEVHGLELVDRLVCSLSGPGAIAVLPTDLLVRTGPGELVVVCPAPAGQRRIMAVVDEIRASVLKHRDPGLPILAGLSISVAFAGSGAAP
jgi:hypothetical protein